MTDGLQWTLKNLLTRLKILHWMTKRESVAYSYVSHFSSLYDQIQCAC